MNNLSIVSHIKNETEFLEQFWKHIHYYEPREIIIIDTGSVDGTYEKLLEFIRDERIAYTIKQEPHYTGQVYIFNKIIEMATSEWVMKIDADELYRHETICEILDVIEKGEYNCISLPTIHHFLNSDLYFDILNDVPDYHQRIFKKEVWGENIEVWSRNHGSIMWAKPLNILTLGIDHAMYHYSLLRPLWKLQKRSIVNYYIDIDRYHGTDVMFDVERHLSHYIQIFSEMNRKCVPTWQLIHNPIPFNTHEDHYISEFIKWGKKVDFPKPQDLIIHKIADWAKAEEAIKHLL